MFGIDKKRNGISYFELSGASEAANDVDEEPNPAPVFVDENFDSVLVK